MRNSLSSRISGIFLICAIALTITGGLLTSNVAFAADPSITINSVTITLQTDADINNYANIGDTIRITADISNADNVANADCTTATPTISVDLTIYGGSNSQNVPILTCNNGVNDIWQYDHVVLNAAGSGIEVASGDNTSKITITATDNDESVNPTLQSAAGLTAANGIDTIEPIITGLEYYSSGGNGSVDRIDVDFSETVNWNYGTLQQFQIDNQDLTGLDDDMQAESASGSGSSTITLETSGTTDLTGVGAGTEPTTDHAQMGTPPGDQIQDAAGNYVPDMGATTIDDGADPALLAFEYEDLSGDGTVDSIYLQVTEDIIDAGFSASDFIVTINGATTGQGAAEMAESLTGAADDDEIDIAFTNGLTFNTNDDYEISIGASKIGDANGNYLPSLTNFDCDDEALPIFASVDPAIGSHENDTDVSYTLSEALAGGQITWTWESGTADGGSPHNQSLTGAELNAGAHTDITLSNDPTLVDGAYYTVSFDGSDGTNFATQVNSTGVKYDTTDPLPTVTVNTDPIYEGALTQQVKITYNEAMDNTSTPAVTFPVNWGAATGGTWSTVTFTNDTYTVNFTHNGNPENVLPATITVGAVSGATDLAHNDDSAGFTTFDIDTVDPTPTPGNISISGCTGTGGACIIGDNVIVEWDAGSDGWTDVASVSPVDMSQFGGAAVQNAVDDGSQCGDTPGDNIWTGCYNITGFETIDNTNRNAVVTAIDNAGNTSAPITGTDNMTVDTIAPKVAGGMQITGATGMMGTFIIGDTPQLEWHPAIAGEIDTIVSVTFDGSDFVAGDTTRTGAWDGLNSIWAANLSTTIDAQETSGNTIDVTVVDNAGNSTGPTTSAGTYDIDTIAPGTPAAPDMQVASDLGTSSTDDLTSDDTPTFDIVAGNGASTMNLLSSIDGNRGFRTGSGAITASTLTEGAHNITLTETDFAGNTSPASTALAITIDTTGPALAETTAVTDPTNDQTPDVSFSSDDTGAISWAGGCDSTTTAATAATQTITLDSDGAGGNLAEATYNCTLTVTDDAGNPTGLALSAFEIDITAPTGTTSVGTVIMYEGDLVQEVTVDYDEDMDGASTPTITFTGATGVLTSNADGAWDAAFDTWTETFTITDADEETSVAVESSAATDEAGNTEGAPSNDTFDIDTLAPTLPTVTIASDNADTTKAVIGDDVTLTITASELINQPVVTYTSGAAAVADAPSTYFPAWTAAYTVNIADTEGLVEYTIDYTDSAGNNGTQVTATTDVSSVSFDDSAPVVVTYSPADDSTGASISGNLVLTFDENVVVGTGNVVLYKTTGDVVVETIDITTASVTFDGTTGVTINPAANMAYSTAYYVQVDATAIEDTVGHPYAGIADKTKWNFTTGAAPPPASSGGGSAGGSRRVTTPAATTETVEEPLVFSDVVEHWAEEFIFEAQQDGYVEGYEDATFKPDQYITRAEASKLVAMWLDDAIGEDACNADLFSDIDCADWYAKYVTYLTDAGVLEGYGEGLFGPGNNINRAEALKMMLFAKAIQDSDITDVINPFSDVNGEQWFYNYVMVGYKLSIVQGYEDGTFGPERNVTRGEFTKIFVETLINN
jgi:methionine-rich copper-binding protein CopC